MSTSTRLTSAPVLAGALVVVTLLAMGPLQPVDEALAGFWVLKYTPGLEIFLDTWPNRIAGQAVCAPILAAVAIWLAIRHRTWHPLVIAVAAEVAFYAGVGGMKILLARTATKAGDEGHGALGAGFWDGGLLEYGVYGISYPSGHAAEGILIYGAIAYLLRTYAEPDWRLGRRLNWVVGLITVNAVAVSFYMGFHWPTDLIAGVIAGALLLRVIVDADHAVAAREPVYGMHLYRFVPERFLPPRPEHAAPPVTAPAPPRPAPPYVVPSPVRLRAEGHARRARRHPPGWVHHDHGLVRAEHRPARDSRHLAS